MKHLTDKDISLSEVHGSVDTTGKAKGWKKIFSFLGPAYLVSVGYMDPETGQPTWQEAASTGTRLYGYY